MTFAPRRRWQTALPQTDSPSRLRARLAYEEIKIERVVTATDRDALDRNFELADAVPSQP